MKKIHRHQNCIILKNMTGKTKNNYKLKTLRTILTPITYINYMRSMIFVTLHILFLIVYSYNSQQQQKIKSNMFTEDSILYSNFI